jgi:pyruvate ferredoxin oxidoreductase alpha subunit
MHELLHWAAGARHPIVMADVNRALGPGWNIWMDQTDSLSQRDTGWIQLYCETNQEVLDTTIQAFRLAESVDVPVMVVLDAFYLSHTAEPVDIPDQALVDRFLPKRRPEARLDVDDPHAFNALVKPDAYMEMRWSLNEAMRDARYALEHIEDDWEFLTGRRWGAVEPYRTEDADLLLVTSGTITSTARHVIDERRARGEKVGLLKMKMFRPFPTAAVRRHLSCTKRVAVLDRNLSPGHGGIFAEEIRSALFDMPLDDRPMLFGYVLGLGGRDVTPATIDEVIDRTLTAERPDRVDLWAGLKT